VFYFSSIEDLFLQFLVELPKHVGSKSSRASCFNQYLKSEFQG
jgi:hypothetical protein